MNKPVTDYRALLKDALIKIKTMQAELEARDKKKNEPIAIVGLACRFPGEANSPERFWQLLHNGLDAMREIPAQRWDVDAFYDPQPGQPGKIYAREGGFLTDIDRFDPDFFNISPREAATLDPQQRLLLEVTWESLEQAAIPPAQLRNSQTGVFLGMMPAEYTLLTHHTETIDTYTGTGTDISMAAGRIAYILGLHGPVLTLDTACSSALVAIHLACQSLRSGECELALAGGSNLILTPEQMIVLSRLQALSPTSRCRTFDAQADGMARGEGCGMVALKTLSAAQRDGDPIWAVIRGSAVNHDGPSSGLTVPNELAQEALIRQALTNAQARPADIGYIEAHGTGTKLGDPIEVGALGAIFAKDRRAPLWIGSVKTNFGHLEAAAGIASLIKVVLSLQHGEIPPSLHFDTPNPLIDWPRLPMRVPTAPTPWSTDKRMAGVSSFGLSGTNAHLVVEAAPAPQPLPSEPGPSERPLERPAHLLTLSARSPAALRDLAGSYATFLQDSPLSLADICYTAARGREHFPHRLAVVASSPAQMCAKLRAYLAGEESAGVIVSGPSPAQPAKTAFLFTGHGGQYVGMARQLYETVPSFRDFLNRCDAILHDSLGRSLLDLLFSGRESDRQALMESHACGQAANFALECALAELWRSWGVHPQITLGHSLGDFASAYVAGVITLEEGLGLVAERGRLMQSTPAVGDMVAVIASEAEIAPQIAASPRVAIAAINGERSVVLSGQREALQEVVERLQALGMKTRRLAIPVAAHSPLMDPILGDFERAVAAIALARPRLPFVSSMSGRLTSQELTDPAYWRKQLRNPVRFADGMRTLHAQGCNIFVEIGPKPTLLGLGSQSLPDEQLAWLPSLRPDTDDWPQMLESLAHLYVRGVAIDWKGFYQDQPVRKVSLPTYPFQRQSYWVSSPAGSRGGAALLGPLIDRRMRSPLHAADIFETEFSVERLPFLAQHRVFGRIISPGACQVALVLSAAELVNGPAPWHLEDLILPAALVLPEASDGTRTAQLVLNDSGGDFQLISFAPAAAPAAASAAPAAPVTHASGRLVDARQQAAIDSGFSSLESLQSDCPDSYPVSQLDAAAQAQQIELGESFHWVTELWTGDDQVLARLTQPESIPSLTGYVLHPGLLDACFQVASLAGPQPESGDPAPTAPRLPFAMQRVTVLQPAVGQGWWCHARRSGDEKWTIRLLDAQGQPVAEIVGYETRQASAQAMGGRESWRDWLYGVEWQPQPLFGLSPDYLPAPQRLALAAGQKVEKIGAGEGEPLAAYARGLADLETLSVAYIVEALESLGADFQPGSHWRTEQLAAQLSVVPPQRRLFGRLLHILGEAGILRPLDRDGLAWQVVAKSPAGRTIQARSAELRDTYASLIDTELTLLTRCGERLAPVLRGAQDPLELLFPKGDASLVNRLYHDAPVSQLLNRQAQAALQEALAALPLGRGARILEIGGGTGGTTAYLLPHLPASQTEYTFTDIGPTFLQQAQEKFGDWPFVAYQSLDIEKSPEAQGLGRHQYDVIIAANVLHATRDLAQTAAHVRGLLAPGGLLILIEQTQAARWVDLTFGMTEGWWRFTDRDRRPHHPLIAGSQWAELLQRQGFAQVQAVPGPAVGQAVFLAQADDQLQESGRGWLIVAEDADAADGAALAARLTERGESANLLLLEQDDGPGIAFDVYRAALGRIPDLAHVVVLGAGPVDGIDKSAAWQAKSQRLCNEVLALVQGMLAESATPPQLWLVSRSAQAVRAQDDVRGMAQALWWGMGWVIEKEHPELAPVSIDIGADDDLDALCAELLTASRPGTRRENQLALRGQSRYTARLARHADPFGQLPARPFQLAIGQRGALESLQLQPASRRTPGPHEIEIRVHATGLNFIDVLDALELLPFARQNSEVGDEFGSECAGEVIAIGAAVEHLAVGDRVVALAFGGFASHYIAPAALAVALPAHLSYAAAATIPTNFLTAYTALHDAARIKAGDRVLIHAGAGGTGMAAIRLAQRAGAEVYATASPSKWETLRRMGVAHLYHSRTLDFARQILADTDGRGVDIVLNSLTGEGFIEASLSALAPRGHFVEIAKRDVWGAEQVAALRPDVTFHFVDLRQAALHEPDRVQGIFQELIGWFRADAQDLRPLPFQTFPIQEVVTAFRTMQQAKYTGKIVVTQPVEAPVQLHADATYLVVGGGGGLGWLTTRWLADRGARHLLLLGRSAPQPEVQVEIEALAGAGVEVTFARGDVAEIGQLAQALAAVDPRYPLRGVIHSAGVLDDGILLEQTPARFARVLGPKVWGAWNLHHLTAGMPLDFFVIYASVAGLLGSAGQANHAAANAFLDALAHHRQAQGLPSLAIDWGAWSQVGAAARREESLRLQAGMGVIDPKRGLEILDYLFAANSAPNSAPGAAQVGVLPVEWSAFAQSQHSAGLSPFLARFQGESQPAPKQSAQASFLDGLAKAEPDKQVPLLMAHLQSQVAHILGHPTPAAIGTGQAFVELGMDSLMAVELRNRLQQSLACRLPSTLVFEYPSISALAEYLAFDALKLADRPGGTPSENGVEVSSPAEDGLDELSDEEIEALLAQELMAIEDGR
jgi:acyl transferase domain-containing protein/acyl carrier protein